MPVACGAVMYKEDRPFGAVPSEPFKLDAPFCLGKTCHYFKQCDLFRSFHAIIEVQFGGLMHLDRAVHNYKDNLNSLYWHPDMMLTVDWVLWNIIVSTYSHYIDTWALNGACVGHRVVLIRSMLWFAMHFGCYRHQEQHFTKDHRRKGIPSTMPLPAIDIDALLTDEEENLKLEQINATHLGILDLLGNPGNLLYAKPQSMAKHFDAMMISTRSIGELPSWGHCRDPEALTRVYEDEAQQACQKILRCLDVRVLDGDLIVLTCLWTPMLILLTGHFMQLYYNPDTQGRYALQFPSSSQGFLQPRGDIRESIMPKGFRVLPADVWEAVDAYFYREELEDEAGRDADGNQEMSTETEAAMMVRRLKVGDPVASASLQGAMRNTLVLAMAPRLQEQEEYYYDSDDSVLNLDEDFPGLAEHIVEWQAIWWGAAPMPAWCQPNFGLLAWSCYDKEPDLWEILDQARQARAANNIPVQMVAPMPLPFATVRDLDCQHQQHFDQTVAKWQSSPLDGEQRKWARTPPQADPDDTPIWEHAQHAGCKDHDRGRSKTRGDEVRQWELDRACSKSRARSKSHKRSKSRKQSKSRKCSKSHRCSKSMVHSDHKVWKPGVWPSQWGQSPSKGHAEEDRSCRPPTTSSHSYEQTRSGGHTAHLAPSREELSKFLKLKEEVTKWPQGYIQGRAKPTLWLPTMRQSNAWWHLSKTPWSMLQRCWPQLSEGPSTGNSRNPSQCLRCLGGSACRNWSRLQCL